MKMPFVHTPEEAQVIAQASRLYAEAVLQDAYWRAQAQIIVAQGQARLERAQAFAITAAASLPWLTVVVSIAGVALLAASVGHVRLGPGRHALATYFDLWTRVGFAKLRACSGLACSRRPDGGTGILAAA